MLEEGFMAEGYMRRLPVYLLLDCSTSMQGEPINAVNEGLGLIYRLLMSDPQAVDTVHISIICFSSHVEQYPLLPIDQFQPPPLSARGTTAMGEAFRVLTQSIEQDLVVNSAGRRGDYRPLVFMLTDGEPTDSYSDALNNLKALPGSRKPTIVVLGCGDAVNTTMLHEVTDHVFVMQTVSSDTIKDFFQWISGSIVQTSHSVGSGGNQALTIPPPTNIPGITYNP